MLKVIILTGNRLLAFGSSFIVILGDFMRFADEKLIEFEHPVDKGSKTHCTERVLHFFSSD